MCHPTSPQRIHILSSSTQSRVLNCTTHCLLAHSAKPANGEASAGAATASEALHYEYSARCRAAACTPTMSTITRSQPRTSRVLRPFIPRRAPRQTYAFVRLPMGTPPCAFSFLTGSICGPRSPEPAPPRE
ncbi:hypothetical protein C8Q76DRAFT_398912 [Earliella scabrosa]|nr:hypothetical protein C8Q76DRAFT_398912 [Earliella scabrosa]